MSASVNSRTNVNNTSKSQTTASNTTRKESSRPNASATKIDKNINQESITFVWLDNRKECTSALIGSLRNINDLVRVLTDPASVLDELRLSNEKIFFISSLSDPEFLNIAHRCKSVEAIFVLDPDVTDIRGDFPKLIGIFAQQEQLLRELRIILDKYERIQLEMFIFENEKFFLWWQLWREDLITRKASPSGRTKMIEFARNYYRSNPKRLQVIDEFERSYRPNDCLRWCCRTLFPWRPMRQALMSQSVAEVNLYNSLIIDLMRYFQQPSKRSAHGQLYRGMKLSNELIDMFEANTGQLVCVSGFFTCTKSRNVELQLATAAGYRSDLSSVLFKIDFDAASRFAEVNLEDGSSLVVFDVATSFRVVCINRGTMSIIKMKTAADDGKKIALDYRDKNKTKTIAALLDELSIPPKPPSPPPPPPTIKAEPKVESKKSARPDPSQEETRAREHLDRGEIDEAIAAYKRIRPMTIPMLKLIARLYIDEKQDFDNAIECYKQALKMEEQANLSTVRTLSEIGDIYQLNRQYDLALRFHHRALNMYESMQPADPNSMASSLTSISNIHRARKELNEALDYGQRAWTLCESTDCEDDGIIAKSLVLLTQIHHDLGDEALGLKLGSRALAIYERMQPSNPMQSAELLHTLGLIQMTLGDLAEAKHYLERALKIYNHIAPHGQSERDRVQKNLQTVMAMQQHTDKLQYYS